MEQPCYKCGQAVEEGVPYCPHCSAPQIRVVIMESAPATAENIATPAEGAVLAESHGFDLPFRGGSLLRPCALAALVGTVLFFRGLYVFVAMPGVGFLSVILYRKRPGEGTSAGLGAKLGAISGVLFSAYIAILSLVAATLPQIRARAREQLLENAQKWAAARPPDPQIQQALELLKTPQGLVATLIVGAIFFLALAVMFGSLGGALAGSVFRRRDKA